MLVSIAAIVVALLVIVALNLPRGSSPGTGLVSPGPSAVAGGSGQTASPRPSSSGRPNSNVGAPGSLPSVNQPAVPVPASIPRNGRTLGAAAAPVALDVWADFQCPACGTFSREVEPVLIQRYVAPGKVRLTFHDFAFIGQESQDAASAARCAGEQGKFWEYQTLVYANQQGENRGWFSRSRLEAFAVAAGVDPAVWAPCYDGGSKRPAVADETAVGRTAGVDSTPSLVLNGKLITLHSWAELLTLLDGAIGAAASPGSTPSPVPTTP